MLCGLKAETFGYAGVFVPHKFFKNVTDEHLLCDKHCDLCSGPHKQVEDLPL